MLNFVKERVQLQTADSALLTSTEKHTASFASKYNIASHTTHIYQLPVRHEQCLEN